MAAIHGEKHWNAKLTRLDVLAIRAKENEEKSNADLAREYGVNKTTIRLIRANATWHDPDYPGMRSHHQGRGWKKTIS